MSLKITLPENPNMPFIVPNSAEKDVREVHVNWRSPDEQLQVKIERIKDEGDPEPQSIEDVLRSKAKQGLAVGKVYIRKLKYKKEDIPAEITVKSIVDNSITYISNGTKNKLISSTVTEEEFLDLIQKYNPK